MDNKVFEIITELVEKGPRAFRSKYSGTCALTGTEFFAGASIRKSEHGYFTNDALGELSVCVGPYDESPESFAERSQRFDFDLFTEWLEAGYSVIVFNKHITSKQKYLGMKDGKYLKQARGYGESKSSAGQVKNWTKNATFMQRSR